VRVLERARDFSAGYYGDGERFIKEMNSKWRELGIADHELIRSR
jgi:hypothetical protein